MPHSLQVRSGPGLWCCEAAVTFCACYQIVASDLSRRAAGGRWFQDGILRRVYLLYTILLGVPLAVFAFHGSQKEEGGGLHCYVVERVSIYRIWGWVLAVLLATMAIFAIAINWRARPAGNQHDDGRTCLRACEGAAGMAEAGMCAFCLLYTSPSPRDRTRSRMPSSA